MKVSTFFLPSKPEEPAVRHNDNWYVVMSQPRNEELALRNLVRQGFEAFLPRRWTTRRRSRGFCTVLEPVFPRYLLISLDLEAQRWRSVNGTYGVSRLVAFGNYPASIPREVAETLRSSTGPDGALVFDNSIRPGDSVRLISGPFANQLGILDRLDDHGRVSLLLNMLGGMVRLSASRADVERIFPEVPVCASGLRGLQGSF